MYQLVRPYISSSRIPANVRSTRTYRSATQVGRASVGGAAFGHCATCNVRLATCKARATRQGDAVSGHSYCCISQGGGGGGYHWYVGATRCGAEYCIHCHLNNGLWLVHAFSVGSSSVLLHSRHLSLLCGSAHSSGRAIRRMRKLYMSRYTISSAGRLALLRPSICSIAATKND